MFRNPVYVKADMDIYEFFKSRGVTIVNDPADFMGTNGCYLYKGREQESKGQDDLTGQILVLAPHPGEVESDTWLKCRRKTLNNKSYQSARKATNTWLAGKARCGRCGHALVNITSANGTGYLRCKKRSSDRSCEGAGKLITVDLQATVYAAMIDKLREFHTLTAQEKFSEANPKLTALKVELAHVETEIEKLLDTLTGANDILISYANAKISELDARKRSLAKQLADLAADEVSSDEMIRISGLLDDWDNVDTDAKRTVVNALIERISATNEKMDIEWKI
jgi:DNA repair exonuclease SbcCD ATPase subunit